MAINYDRLFTTLGKVVGGLDEANAFRGTTLGTRADTLSAQFDAALQDVAEGLYPARDVARTSFASWINYLSRLASAVIQAEVNADRPLPVSGLISAVVELDRQMRIDSESLEDSPASISVTPILVDGDAVLSATTLQPDGTPAQLALPDLYIVTVPRGHLQGDTAFRETLALAGTKQVLPPTNWNWPGGSGVRTSLSVRDGNTNIGLTNGRLSIFTGWTRELIGEWSLAAATSPPRAGYTADVAHFSPSGSSGYIEQTVTVQAQRLYAWSVRVFKGGGTQDWDFTVSLQDDSGTVTSQTVAASALSAGWNTVTGFFATPAFLDGLVKFRIAYENYVAGSDLQICHAAFLQSTPVYPGGPTFVAWAGTLPLTNQDTWEAEVTIGGTGALHQGIDRLINLRSILTNGLPVDNAAPTQADTLVS